MKKTFSALVVLLVLATLLVGFMPSNANAQAATLPAAEQALLRKCDNGTPQFVKGGIYPLKGMKATDGWIASLEYTMLSASPSKKTKTTASKMWWYGRSWTSLLNVDQSGTGFDPGLPSAFIDPATCRLSTNGVAKVTELVKMLRAYNAAGKMSACQVGRTEKLRNSWAAWGRAHQGKSGIIKGDLRATCGKYWFNTDGKLQERTRKDLWRCNNLAVTWSVQYFIPVKVDLDVVCVTINEKGETVPIIVNGKPLTVKAGQSCPPPPARYICPDGRTVVFDITKCPPPPPATTPPVTQPPTTPVPSTTAPPVTVPPTTTTPCPPWKNGYVPPKNPDGTCPKDPAADPLVNTSIPAAVQGPGAGGQPGVACGEPNSAGFRPCETTTTMTAPTTTAAPATTAPPAQPTTTPVPPTIAPPVCIWGCGGTPTTAPPAGRV